MDWLEEIISVYLYVCSEYANGLWTYCQRFSNYADLSFSDEDVITIYMYGIMAGLTTKKQIYKHSKNYWYNLFPNLPGYEAYVQRVNRLGDLFVEMIARLQRSFPSGLFTADHRRLVDSMPIIMARGTRRFKAKVAPQIADKNGYCAAKKLHYYGVKLHIVGSAQNGTIPIPDKIGITPAGMSDVKAYQAVLPEILDYEKFADKAYVGNDGTKTYIPIKKQKGQKYLDAADRLYSTAISRIRQPIESLFNWIEQKVKIQSASKVRSYNGLIVHIFGKLAGAFKLLLPRFCS